MLRPVFSTVTFAATALVVVAAPSLGGCNENDRAGRRQSGTAAAPRPDGDAGPAAGAASRPSSPASTRPATFAGTLRGSAVAIGGETTGWRLEGDNQTGGIDIDVSRVARRARELDGKRVTVTGRMTTRSWPERGQTQVLLADRIEVVPEPAPGGGRTPAQR